MFTKLEDTDGKAVFVNPVRVTHVADGGRKELAKVFFSARVDAPDRLLVKGTPEVVARKLTRSAEV